MAHAIWVRCKILLIMAVVVGPKGLGKTTCIQNVLSTLGQEQRVHFSCYDFETCAALAPQVTAMRWLESIVIGNELLSAQTKGKNPAIELCKQLENNANVMTHITKFLARITSKGAYNADVAFVDSIKRQQAACLKGKLGTDFLSVCHMISKAAPKSIGVAPGTKLTQLESLVLLLHANSNIHSGNDSTARQLEAFQQGATRVLVSLQILSRFRNAQFACCLDGIETLATSTHLQHNGVELLGGILKACQDAQASAIAICNDSGALLKMSHAYYARMLEYGPRHMYHSQVTRDNDLVKVLYKISGGNLGLVDTLIKSFKVFCEETSLAEVREMLAGSTQIVDDEYFPLGTDKDAKMAYLERERIKCFIRQLHTTSLEGEIIIFENKMNRMHSLDSIQALIEKIGNRIHAKVTINETIRQVIREPHWRLEPGAKVENTVLLAMLSCGLLHHDALAGRLH
ncbi:hypothetical protein BdWA1_001649 [Babesia duncani]|uniref:Uncharacterized protein n=1 Tax=Babesia duncani TaxID=323732 RepID=A0AAD9UNU1_9APIC|nr:hypothetical protein BdWA1_001649 [Babesia duncani]